MIKNIWDTIQFVCSNHPDTPLQIVEGPHSPFYACPKYFPENRKERERACGNRMNLIDCEKIVSHVMDKIYQNLMDGIEENLENDTWTYKGIECKVLVHSEEKIVIAIKNKKALGSF